MIPVDNRETGIPGNGSDREKEMRKDSDPVMTYTVTLKDGRNMLIFNDRDILDITEQTAGTEFMECLRDRLYELNESADELEKTEKMWADEVESMRDHQRGVLNDALDEVEAILDVLKDRKPDLLLISEHADAIKHILYQEL